LYQICPQTKDRFKRQPCHAHFDRCERAGSTRDFRLCTGFRCWVRPRNECRLRPPKPNQLAAAGDHLWVHRHVSRWSCRAPVRWWALT